MDDLEIAVQADGSALILRLSGEIDLANCERLRNCLESIQGDVDTIVVDLASVRFIDSSGMNTLLASANLHAAADRQLVLRSPTDTVARVLEIGGISDLIPVVD